MSAEQMQRAANTIDSAADQMRKVVGQFEDCVFRLEKLFGQGYSNNIEQLIEALNNIPRKVETDGN